MLSGGAEGAEVDAVKWFGLESSLDIHLGGRDNAVPRDAGR